MEYKIFKQPLGIVPNQSITLPVDAQILDAQVQRGKLQLWVLFPDPQHTKMFTRREIRIIATGQPVTEEKHLCHIATVQMDEGYLVLHIFEAREGDK